MIKFKSRARMLASVMLASLAISVAAAELPPLPAGLTAVSKPVQLPAFTLATPAGSTVRAEEFRGKVLIARFWATW